MQTQTLYQNAIKFATAKCEEKAERAPGTDLGTHQKIRHAFRKRGYDPGTFYHSLRESSHHLKYAFPHKNVRIM